MKNTETIPQDTFQMQTAKFNYLLEGSKASMFATFILIGFSILLMYYSRENLLSILALFSGASLLTVYIFNFLVLKNIQKPENPKALISSISQFKAYMSKRKRNEIIFMSIWFLSTIPAAAQFLESGLQATVLAFICIIIIAVFGILGFKKVDHELESLESVLNINI